MALSPEEFEQLKNQLTIKPLNLSESILSQKEEPGYFERLGSQFKETAQNIISDVQAPAEAVAGGAGLGEIAIKTGEAGLRTAGNVAGTAFAPIAELLSPVVSPLVGKLIQSIPGAQSSVQSISDWAERNPNLAKDAGAIFNIALLLLGPKTAKEAIVKGSEKTSSIIGGGLKGTGERALRVTAPMEQSTAVSMQAYQAAQPTLLQRISGFLSGQPAKPSSAIKAPVRESETAVRLGIKGTEWGMGVQAKRATKGLWDNVINPELSKIKESVNMKQFFSDLKQRIITENADLARRHTLLRAWESLSQDFKNVSKISYRKLQDYKSGWTKFIPEKAFKGEPISGALNEIRNMASQEARAIIYKKIPEAVRQAYWDYGNLQSMIESGIKSIDALRSKSVFRQVWEFVLDKAVTPVASYGGNFLYKTGEGVEFIGKKGIKKVGEFLVN